MAWSDGSAAQLANVSTDSASNSSQGESVSGVGTSGSSVVDASVLCGVESALQFESRLLGISIAVPEWEAVLTALTLTAIIVLTIVGNVLVILSVFTYKPLRIVQNFFIVSLAVSDLTVAILVLPLNVAYSLIRRWEFGIHVCKMWLTCDVLCCTASILNLCAIALDRYWAITDPINYAQKRTLKRVLFMIGAVWLVSLVISSPPLAGWNDWPEVFHNNTPCQLTSQQGYVIYSSLGSFYIPLFIMTLVYIEIFIATKRRLRERAQASKLNAVKQNIMASSMPVPDPDPNAPGSSYSHGDAESVSSETNHNEAPALVPHKKPRSKRKRKKGSIERRRQQQQQEQCLAPPGDAEESITETPASPNKGVGHEGEDLCPTAVTSAGASPALKSSHARDGASSCRNATAAALQLQQTATLQLAKKNVVYQFIEEKQRISLSKERRAARTLGIIMGVFVFCWLPFFLMYVILPFCPSCCPSEKLINFVTWLGYINSALNPIIYTIFNLDFRRAFKKLLHLKP